ncbi:hypothetical protein L227DRAFT_570890 [Lentinus tigrinus ALCF2SS1-6]|uniref:Uncharacterized protein n=1 Tax=Lentinus tigrinus ALCF2SS1-6 TaxID=1328759 RepID=A0A5C2SQ32_9APHY|nr:hypothetical protein L227DRAFT_570890 [Lentinus tigrinus ALCF2SS1-6]
MHLRQVRCPTEDIKGLSYIQYAPSQGHANYAFFHTSRYSKKPHPGVPTDSRMSWIESTRYHMTAP